MLAGEEPCVQQPRRDRTVAISSEVTSGVGWEPIADRERHTEVMRSLRLATSAILVLAACSAEARRAGVPSTSASAIPITAATVPTAQSSCVGEAASVDSGPLTIKILPPTQCDSSHAGTLRVTNSGTDTCRGDVIATIDSSRMLFRSGSGYGGAIGTWETMPDDAVEAVGVVEYPPGSRSWDIVAANLPEGPHTWSFVPGLSCGNVSIEPRLTFASVAVS
jgi:hypothetical protein